MIAYPRSFQPLTKYPKCFLVCTKNPRIFWPFKCLVGVLKRGKFEEAEQAFTLARPWARCIRHIPKKTYGHADKGGPKGPRKVTEADRWEALRPRQYTGILLASAASLIREWVQPDEDSLSVLSRYNDVDLALVLTGMGLRSGRM